MSSNTPCPIINLLGGPCSRKTTWRNGLFFFLRREGINCEEIVEWVKKPIFEGRQHITKHQAYIFGKQLHATDCVLAHARIAVTDSPVILSAYYGRKYAPEVSDLLYQGMIEEFKRRGGCNIFLRRVGDYDPVGRIQTQTQADAVADELKHFLESEGIDFTEFMADDDAGIIKHAIDFARSFS